MNKLSYVLIFLIGSIPLSYAALGEPEASIEIDQKKLSGVRKDSVKKASYKVTSIEISGTNIRQYVSADGIVFAVAWDGLTHPNLTTLLGNYSNEYQKVLKQQRNYKKYGRRARQSVKANNVTVEKWGHMRNLQGRAFVPSLIPAGVSADEIK
jgi:hypothetical protein